MHTRGMYLHFEFVVWMRYSLGNHQDDEAGVIKRNVTRLRAALNVIRYHLVLVHLNTPVNGVELRCCRQRVVRHRFPSVSYSHSRAQCEIHACASPLWLATTFEYSRIQCDAMKKLWTWCMPRARSSWIWNDAHLITEGFHVAHILCASSITHRLRAPSATTPSAGGW